MSIFICSNVNIDPIVKRVKKSGVDAIGQAGYGNEFEPFLNKNSEFWKSEVPDAKASNAEVPGVEVPDAGVPGAEVSDVLILVHGDALFSACTTRDEAISTLDNWFENLEACIDAQHNFYVSDILCTKDPYFSDFKHSPARELEAKFSEKLIHITQKHTNVFLFRMSDVLIKLGVDKAISEKMWYLARIPYSSFAEAALAREIVALAKTIGHENVAPSNAQASETATPSKTHTPKKVLVVDLDNTLWGGVVGEVGALKVMLSDEKMGLIYKDVQRELLRMKRTGVLLAIVSKNNFDDAAAVFRENTHMILKLDDFVATKINWENKDKNIAEIASELNLGLDSFVFLDDNPTERDLILHSLPDVEVIDFPHDISHLPAVLRRTYAKYFKRPALVAEDFQKTEQYRAKDARENLKKTTKSFDDYLQQLEIVAKIVEPEAHIDRICQLIEKTNQFNLTTKRYTPAQVQTMVENPEKFGVFAFEIVDKFGNNGITALAIVGLDGKHAHIDTLILSCRIMGKNIENFVVDYIERWCEVRGIEQMFATYISTKKNVPTRELFDNLGYDVICKTASKTEYSLMLNARSKRHYFVEFDWA